jgi:hypothetical protein
MFLCNVHHVSWRLISETVILDLVESVRSKIYVTACLEFMATF